MMKSLPLKCPCDLKCSLKKDNNSYKCTYEVCIHSKGSGKFRIVNEKPVIISEFKTDTICKAADFSSYVSRSGSSLSRLRRTLFGDSPVTKNNCKSFVEKLKTKRANPIVLIIGGAERGLGTEELWEDHQIEIHSVDVYSSDTVDLICDGHYLPLESNFYDGVWIQAVLEHVVEPQKVVAEIFRVLNDDGLVYAETPFMQHVHEGAHDFTRYTVLGHRFLFRKFALIDMGGVRGAELVFAWSVKYLILAIFRNKLVSKAIGSMVTICIRPLSRFVSKTSMYDSASAVYFFGSKSKEHTTVTHKEIIQLYEGDVN